MSENDATKGVLINTVSRRMGKDLNGSDVFTQYVITTKVLEDALAGKIENGRNGSSLKNQRSLVPDKVFLPLAISMKMKM
jgi:hypothetical protein